MKRRDFIKKTALMAGAAGWANNALADETKVVQSTIMNEGQQIHAIDEGPLIISAPMLQNYAETSMGVAFAVSDLSNGYVIVGRQPDLSDGEKVKCGGYRTTEISDRVIQVRLTNLLPNTTYYYKIGADRIHYGGGYDMKITGNEEDPRIYHFTTAGSDVPAHFCVINDTHARWEPFGLAIDKVACPGNHDSRGMANRHLERIWMYRQPEERVARDWDLGRNFAVRMGEMALIGLDTAEDKLDTNPLFAGLFNSGPYREAQVAWLDDVLHRPEIASAPFLVAFCHIPLFEPDPRLNPGDVAPADKDPQYTTDFAMWQRTCANLWGPLLQKAGCQLVITAHQHQYRYDAPTQDRCWAQMVGGGPEMGFTGSGDSRRDRPEKFPTVIEGKVVDGKLQVKVHNLLTGKVQDSFIIERRI